MSTLISGEQVTEIATENRNFTALAALGLGVSSKLPDNNTPTSVASSASISVNGLRESHNIWLIDGGEADDRGGAGGMDVMPSPDAIAQFEVLASNYPPDYGISSGATMSLSLKSGTQKFHGEAYEFFRNDDLDANYFFNKYNGADSPVAKAAPEHLRRQRRRSAVHPARLQPEPAEDLLLLQSRMAPHHPGQRAERTTYHPRCGSSGRGSEPSLHASRLRSESGSVCTFHG